MLALDNNRLKLGLVSGWGYSDHLTVHGKFCTRIPSIRMREICEWSDFLTLAQNETAILVLNGDDDPIIDDHGTGVVWQDTRVEIENAAASHFGKGRSACWFEAGGGHRPYHGHKVALELIHKHLGTPGWTVEDIQSLPTVNAGAWCDQNGIQLENLYGTEQHQRGMTLPDLGLRAIEQSELACLRADEVGDGQYTIEGWLELISGEEASL